MRPWSDRPITDCYEPLVSLPLELLRLEPHPYVSVGAPYGPDADPFRLRSGVVQRLLRAQQALKQRHPELRLAIFDAWRPVAVQAFMVEFSVEQEAQRCGVDRDDAAGMTGVREAVNRFWAEPSRNPATPPPHSTGGAVDLTLASSLDGTQLFMGGMIDAINEISEPDHFVQAAAGTDKAIWHKRRCLLRSVMSAAGFAQHPNEWWHFSHGDQLWAWISGQSTAIYAEADNRSLTA